MKLTRKKAMECNVVFHILSRSKGKLNFQYVLRKNINALKEEVEIVDNLKKKIIEERPEEYKQYEEEKYKIIESLCEKDENGNPKQFGNPPSYVFSPENKVKVDQKIEELDEKYKDTLEKDEKKMKEFFDFIEEEIELDFQKFKLKEMPLDEEIEQKYINAIFDLIEED